MVVKRRKFIRIISYLIALCVVFAASGLFAAKAKSDYESALERVRFEGLASLTEYSREISSGLRLLAVSTGDSLADSRAYVSSRAVGALGSLGCFESKNVDNLIRVFSGLYDFSEKFSGSEENRKAAVKLSDYTQEIYYHLSDLTNAIVNGKYSLTEYGDAYKKDKPTFFEYVLDFSNGAENEVLEMISPAAASYGSCMLLAGKRNVDTETARELAGNAANIRPLLWRGGAKSIDGIDMYEFTCGDVLVNICKAGGVLCKMVNPCQCGESIYSLNDARKKALDFSQSKGFEQLVEIYARRDAFTARFIFVPEINGVLLLTAKIEIETELENGKITYFDASEYVKRCRTDIGAPNGVPEISSALPNNLKCEKLYICVADINGREKLCCLAKCLFENSTVYAFIDYYSLKVIKTVLVQ